MRSRTVRVLCFAGCKRDFLVQYRAIPVRLFKSREKRVPCIRARAAEGLMVVTKQEPEFRNPDPAAWGAPAKKSSAADSLGRARSW